MKTSLSIWTRAFANYSPKALRLRLQELKDGYHNDSEETKNIKIQAIESLLK